MQNWESFTPAVMKLLRTRDCLKLALESGEIPIAAQVRDASNFDITLFAIFLPYLTFGKVSKESDLATQIPKTTLKDSFTEILG